MSTNYSSFDPDWVSSEYGDPELALMANEELALPSSPPAEVSPEVELAAFAALLRPIDRIILRARATGATQAEIASALGLTQPAVCDRLRRISEWARLVVPVRLRTRGAAISEGDGDALVQVVWQSVVLGHRGEREVARARQLSVERLRVALKSLERVADDPRAQALLEARARAPRQWAAPYWVAPSRSSGDRVARG